MRNPGMQSLTIRGERKDDSLGYIDVRVEPSVVVVPHGVFVLVNHHVEVKAGEEIGSAPVLMDILRKDWDEAYWHSRKVIDAVREVALEQDPTTYRR
jgi:hypothetical protein